MTQNKRDLLLKDLTARLPYGVICKDDYAKVEGKLIQIGINYDMCLLSDDYGKTEFAYIPNCKPYLFPLSSMTDKQNDEYLNTCKYNNTSFPTLETFEWCLENHFDYRNLISMGLAIDATDLNIY